MKDSLDMQKATACTINVVSTWIVNVLEGPFQDQNIGKVLSLVFVVFSGITPRFYFINNVCFLLDEVDWLHWASSIFLYLIVICSPMKYS